MVTPKIVHSVASVVRRSARPQLWRQIPWRLRAQVDRSGRIESTLLTDVEWSRRFPQEEQIFSRDGRRPLRILLACMRYDYGSRRRGLSYEETHFAGTLKDWGYEVVHFDFVELARRYGTGRMNEMLRECAVRTTPDIAFFVLFRDELEPDTIQFLREQDVLTINWFCDDQWRYESFSRSWAPFFDMVTTTSDAAFYRYLADGYDNVLKTQWAFNPYIFKREASPRVKDLDITFVGQPHGDRREVISALIDNGLRVEAYGYGWPNGRISYGRMIELYRRSAIVLGLSNDSSGEVQQIKGRDFEVPAVRACHATAYHPELGGYFEIGREIVCYEGVDELIGLCHELLASRQHEEIARAGLERAWREHTYVHRFGEIFSAAGLCQIDSREQLCV